MNVSRNAIEKIKNVLIVVLVLSTILLLYFLWNDDPVGDFRIASLSAAGAEQILVKDVISPEKITVSFGAENYTAFASATALWDSPGQGGGRGILQELQDFMENEAIAVSSISEADYVDVIRARSIQADFPFQMPLVEFCAEYGLKRPMQLDIIGSFTCIAYSDISPNSVFIADKTEKRYYRLAVDAMTARFSDIITNLEGGGNASFYPLGTYSGVENEVMVPIDMQISMPEITYRRDVDVSGGDSGRIGEMAKRLFGDSFDFARKITEGSGTTVYMYGYGERVLVINPDGSFEYRAAEGGPDSQATYFAALRSALDFIAYNGGLGEQGGGSKELYLKDVESQPGGRRAFRFTFGMRMEGHDVHYLDSEPFIVEVSGSKITHYKRDVIDSVDVIFAEAGSKQAFRPFDIIAGNFASIYGTLVEAGAAPVERGVDGASEGGMNERMFEAVAQGVSDVSVGLLRAGGPVADAPGGQAELLPVWAFTIGGVDFFFDLYTGAGVGYKA